MNKEDEIIELNNQNFSVRKILGESNWKTYIRQTKEIRELVKLKITLDLYQIYLFESRDLWRMESVRLQNDKEN